MVFRYARHTNDLKKITDFYCRLIGFKKLGEFKNHSDYNGVFLGYPDSDWHLEFTESKDEADHHSDEDDLLVFYTRNVEEFEEIKHRLIKEGLHIKKSKNPYWNKYGIEVTDPDGFGIIIAKSR